MKTYTSISEIAKHFEEIQPRTYEPIKYSLDVAIGKIEAILQKGHKVTGIQFEDGSGYKFNYQVNGGKWQFINLNTHTLNR